MGMGKVKKLFASSEVAMAMLLVQIFATGLQILSRVILRQGTFILALMTYRNVVAAICVAPFAFYFEREITKKLSWPVWFWLFLSALTGMSMTVGLYYYGLRDTNATYAMSFFNLIPMVTFVFSTIVGIEKLGLTTKAGKKKILGAIFSVAGALIACLYEVKAFHIGHQGLHHSVALKTSMAHWVRGTFVLVGFCLSYSVWYIVQAKLLKIFPSKYWAIMLACIISSMQSAVIVLCFNRQKAAWSLGWNLQLLTIVYSGALATAGTFCLVTWAIAIRGPIYVPMFNPLSLIFVSILEALILGAYSLLLNYQCRLLGSVLIIVGLYSFLWGKRKEMKSLLQTNNDAGSVVAPTTADESAVV